MTQGFKFSTDRDAYLEGTSHTLRLLRIEDAGRALAEEIIGRFESSGSVELYQDSMPILRGLRADGIRIGIATGRWQDPSIDLRAVGLAPHVDVVYHAGLLESQKNERAYWSALLERERLAAETVVLVDDNSAAVAAAQMMGITAYRIQRHDSPIGSPELADFAELSRLPPLLESR